MALLLAACALTKGRPVIGENGVPVFIVKGEVIWKGPAPVVYPIPTTAYTGACGKRHAKWMLRLKKTRLWHKRLLDIAVWLEPVWEEMAPPDIEALQRVQTARATYEPIKIVEEGCEFRPRMIVVPTGSMVEIVNNDRKDHWFVIDGRHRKREQYVQYYGSSPSVFTFDTPGVHHMGRGVPVEFLADRPDIWHLASGFHRWMEGWVVVTDKVWFDEQLDKNGIFEISNVPRGVYRVHTWHPLLGENTSVVRVPDELGRLVAVNYVEDPSKIEDITSTVTTTAGEVREEHKVWRDIEEW